MEQNREPRKKNPHLYGQLIYEKEARIYNGVKTVYLIHSVGKTGQMYAKKKMKLDHLLISYTRIKLKWFKDLHVRLEIIKFLKENISIQLPDIALSIIFSSYISLGKKTKRKIEQMGLHQTINFLHSKENINKMKRHPTEWQKTFATYTFDKGLTSKTNLFLKFNLCYFILLIYLSLLFNYSCLQFLPTPPPHSSQTQLPHLLPPRPFFLSMCLL